MSLEIKHTLISKVNFFNDYEDITSTYNVVRKIIFLTTQILHYPTLTTSR